MPASDNKINLVGNKLNRMYYLIWSSGCLLSLPVVTCVLGPVLSCYCYVTEFKLISMMKRTSIG